MRGSLPSIDGFIVSCSSPPPPAPPQSPGSGSVCSAHHADLHVQIWVQRDHILARWLVRVLFGQMLVPSAGGEDTGPATAPWGVGQSKHMRLCGCHLGGPIR